MSTETKNIKVEKVEGGYLHYCPACKNHHFFDSRWKFSGTLEKPTFSPSMMINKHTSKEERKNNPLCHYFLRNGQIQFLNDCSHKLAGKTVECPNFYKV